jgi:hypothetical protein
VGERGQAGGEPGSTDGPASTPSRRLLDRWSVAIVVLSSLQPFVAFLQANADKLIEPRGLALPALGWTALVLAVFAGVRALAPRRPAVPVAVGVAAFNLSFWNFNRWLPYEPAGWGPRLGGLAAWALLTALVVALAVRLAAHPAARAFVATLFGFWVLASLAGFVVVRGQAGGDDEPGRYTGPPFTFAGERPDVYWFVLDEHARTDQLLRLTGEDNSWFHEELAERGFSVSESTTSAYLETHLSIPSTLSMDYTLTPGADVGGVYQLAASIVQGDNPVVETFEANGYRFVYAPDGMHEWARCQASGDRVCIDPAGGSLAVREPLSVLVRSTPVGSFDLPIAHNDLDSILDGVERADLGAGPRFVFGHVMSPHFPFRYDQDCRYRDRWLEGLSYSGAERAAAYAQDLACLDRAVVDAVDRIVADDPDAVIIVQSDHGSRLSFNLSTPFAEMTPERMAEGFAALNAIRLPEPCRTRSIEGEPLVNTFRLVLACLAGTEPDLLEARTFFAEFGRPDTLREVPVPTRPAG